MIDSQCRRLTLLFDLNHPAHVHFFRNPIRLLADAGHQIVVASRDKEVALPLLDELGIPHRMLSRHASRGAKGLMWELVARDWALWRVVRQVRPQAIAAIGGTFASHVGFATRTPSVVFYDTENARLQNAITYPFAGLVVVPRCYGAWTPRRHQRYDGYHELSYLHPDRFTPDREIALRSGLASAGDNFVVRVVSWQANHDIAESGWSVSLLRQLVTDLAARGRVHLSSEAPLPEDLARHAYRGRVSDLHHLMAFSRLFVGESATMASECAVLGVPAIYAAKTGRGYTDEQEQRYRLVRNLRDLQWDSLRAAIDASLAVPVKTWLARRKRLLAETVDVAQLVADIVVREARRI